MKSLHFVACTRGRKEDTDLFRSLTRLRAGSFQFFENNRVGVAERYNQVLAERAGRDEIVVFLHDDVLVTDVFVVDKLNEAINRYGFTIIGVAGTSTYEIAPRDRLSNWLQPQSKGNSGSLEHVVGEDTLWTACGPTPRRCVVMDGVFLAVDVERIGQLRFDEQFAFHFYDLDFCLSADREGLTLGTTNVHMTHRSYGNYDAAFADAQAKFRTKWSRPNRQRLSVGGEVIALDNPVVRNAYHSGPLGEWMAALCHLPCASPTSAWSGHIPFLSLLIQLLRPRVFVELGVYLGASFIAACSAAERFDVQTKCVGVDTWEGDPHAGRYKGDRVFELLTDYLSKNYINATLIRGKFEDAVAQFDDGSVDLLHIDGLHTYEAVSADFANWLPKISERGVVLFHDIEVRDRGFGVWKFWSEIKARYRSFEFPHSFGLGMLIVGDRIPPRLERFLQYVAHNPEAAAIVQRVCSVLGDSLRQRLDRRDEYLPEPERLATAAFVSSLNENVA